MGRQSKFSEKAADFICGELALGKSLREICRAEDAPSTSMVFRWLADNEAFRDQYAHAKQAGVEALAEELLEIADDGSNDWMERHYKEQTAWVENGEAIRRSALRVDARKWILSKLAPKKYGDKVALTGENGGPMVIEIVKFGDK